MIQDHKIILRGGVPLRMMEQSILRSEATFVACSNTVVNSKRLFGTLWVFTTETGLTNHEK